MIGELAELGACPARLFAKRPIERGELSKGAASRTKFEGTQSGTQAAMEKAIRQGRKRGGSTAPFLNRATGGCRSTAKKKWLSQLSGPAFSKREG